MIGRGAHGGVTVGLRTITGKMVGASQNAKINAIGGLSFAPKQLPKAAKATDGHRQPRDLKAFQTAQTNKNGAAAASSAAPLGASPSCLGKSLLATGPPTLSRRPGDPQLLM